MSDTYYMDESNRIVAGRFSQQTNPLLDLLVTMPENSWQNIRQNTFQSAWLEPELRPPYLNGKASPEPLIRAWSGFAYDSSRHWLVLWGGGHANTSDNTPYIFDMLVGNWFYAFLPSDYHSLNSDNHAPICGGFRQPCSSHVYDNNIYLPLLDRFCTFGGAQHGDGGYLKLHDPANSYVYLRPAGAYLLDLNQAGQGLVAGGTGDNPKSGSYSGVNLAGADAWQLRDWFATGQSAAFGSAINTRTCHTAYRQENGHDVIYATRTSSTTKSLYRIEFHLDPAADVISRVGRPWNGNSGEMPAALDSQRNVYVMCNSGTVAAFVFWDLDYAGSTNNDQRVRYDSIAGDITDFFNDEHRTRMGIDFSQQLEQFVLWGNGGRLYYLTPPAGKPTSTNGWHIERVEPTGSARPMTRDELNNDGGSGVGIFGKWKYAADLGCFIGLQHALNGDVWLYKPRNWVDPRTLS